MTDRSVDILEVAPRDGFQSIAQPIPTGEKIAIIQGLIDAGCPRIEIGSFVSPKALPQMADIREIVEHFRDQDRARLTVLVPNLRGAELALEQQVGEMGYVFSVSEIHNQSNVRRTVEQSLGELRAIVSALEAAPGTRLRVSVATAFDCPFDGTVPAGTVRDCVRRVAELAPKAEIALCDTTGRANPFQVRERFRDAMALPETAGNTWAFHGHDTFGMGVANALFAHDAGVRAIDAAAGGLGGCPFAPGATGNTATEDLVFAFEEAGLHTGIHMGQLLDVADRIARIPNASMGGHLRRVPRERAVLAKAG